MDLSELFGKDAPVSSDPVEEKVEAPAEKPPAEPPAEEPPPAQDEKKPGEVNWEKRFKDTERAFQAANVENKRLREQFDDVNKRLREAEDELFPDRVEDKKDEEARQKEWEEKVTAAERIVRPVYSDYDVKVGTSDNPETPFRLAVVADPKLWARVQAADNPALEAYHIAKEFEDKQKYGSSIEEIRANLEKELREKIQTELAEKKTEATKPNLPVTLRDTGGGGGGGTAAPSIPPLKDVFGGR